MNTYSNILSTVNTTVNSSVSLDHDNSTSSDMSVKASGPSYGTDEHHNYLSIDDLKVMVSSNGGCDVEGLYIAHGMSLY